MASENRFVDLFDQDNKITNNNSKNNSNSSKNSNRFVDLFNSGDGNYTSTTKTPEKKAGYIVSAGAGILSGAEKAVEGVLTTGTILADLGLGTELTKEVEDWFDKQAVFNKLEDLADDTWLGKTTEILTQLGVPGGFALKGANALLKAKNLGILSKVPNLTKFGAAGLADVAASTKDIPTLGDIIGAGPTEQRKNQGEKGRSEAFRRLTNKFKFGMEGALGFSLFDKVLIPGATAKEFFKRTIPTVKGVIRDIKGPGANIVRKEIDLRKGSKTFGEEIDVVQQLEPGWAFSNNNILRKFHEVIGSKLTAASKWAGTNIFKTARDKINFTRGRMEEQVRITTQKLGNTVDDLLDPNNKNNIIKVLEGKGLNDRTKLMETIHEFLGSGGMGRMVKYTSGPDKGKTKFRPYTPEELKTQKDFLKSKLPEELLPHMITIRNSIDELSNQLLKTPGIEAAPGMTKEFLDSGTIEYRRIHYSKLQGFGRVKY